MPVAVETGVSYLRPRADELPDGDFVGRVVESADCGLLLDLHNVYCNSRNGRQPLDEYLDQLPLDRVWEMHLAGGMEMGGFWLDAHSGAIPDPLYAIAERLAPRLPNLKAIIFEIFPSFVPVVGLDLVREQVERLHALWALRAPARERSPAPVRLRLDSRLVLVRPGRRGHMCLVLTIPPPGGQSARASSAPCPGPCQGGRDPV